MKKPRQPRGNSVQTPGLVPIVGHGQLLKALNALPGCTDQLFRIGAMYLAHTRPPDLSAFPKTETIAERVGRSKRSVERCRKWLRDAGAIRTERGGGRGRAARVDFTPLAEQINFDAIGAKLRKTSTATTETPTAATETPTETPPYRDKDPILRTLNKKDSADVRATEAALAALPVKTWTKFSRVLEAELPAEQFNTWVRPLQAVHEDTRLILLAPNRFVVDRIGEHYLDQIAAWWRAETGDAAASIDVRIGSHTAESSNTPSTTTVALTERSPLTETERAILMRRIHATSMERTATELGIRSDRLEAILRTSRRVS